MESYKGVVVNKIAGTIPEGISNLSVQTLHRNKLGDKDVRIKVYATALNYFDLLLLIGKYQLKPSLPFVIGSECSGEIIEVGKKVSHLKVGDQVIVGMSTGTLAEEVVAPALLCIKKPSSFTHEEAAALFVGFMTAYHGLVQRGNLKSGEWCLVTGSTGGMGLAAIQLAKILGAKVIAAASSDDKLEVARKLGADYFINYSKEDLKEKVEKITNGKYIDVCYEIVGGEIFEKCVRCMGDAGRLLVIGFASGIIPKLSVNMALIKGFSLVGVRAGESMRRNPQLAIEMYQRLQEWTDEGKLKPYIDKIFDLSNYKEAFTSIDTRKVLGKAVVRLQNVPSKL